jgi:hypothetical protein
MQLHVVQSVDRRNFGGTQTTTGALYSSYAKPVAMNGWNSPQTLASSKKEPSDRSAAPAAKAQAQGRNFLCQALAWLRKSSRRGVNQSPILVIYQLLLKNNTKYWVGFWRNVRAGVFS